MKNEQTYKKIYDRVDEIFGLGKEKNLQTILQIIENIVIEYPKLASKESNRMQDNVVRCYDMSRDLNCQETNTLKLIHKIIMLQVDDHRFKK